ncbi:MAG: F0F1 ATP synthase subunit epsilon [Propionibacteriaceae bacterium]|nr:F0F1 ATP synthase subunit epsilon [Propionibacteriaceae bacterium]
MASELQVGVVAPDGQVWQGEAVSVIVRTTEGDIGIQRNHEPVMAAMMPCAAEVVASDGRREIIAVGGGFISVYDNRVSLLSETASLAGEVSPQEADKELAEMQPKVDSAEMTDQDWRRYHQLEAQLKAGERYAQLHGQASEIAA